jgi:hypothetical protein
MVLELFHESERQMDGVKYTLCRVANANKNSAEIRHTWIIGCILCYKLDGCGFDSRRGHRIFQLTYSFQPHYGPGATQPLTEMSTRNLPGSKGCLARKAYNPTAICELNVQKMWEPRHLTTLWASTVCYRDSFTFCTVYEITAWTEQ